MGWRDWASAILSGRTDLAAGRGNPPATSTAFAASLPEIAPTPQLTHMDSVRELPKKVVQRADSLLNPLTGLGSETRDKGAAARPDTQRGALTYQELTHLVWKNGLANRIVTSVAEDAVSSGWNTQDDFKDFDQAIGVQQKMGKTLASARTYGGAGILMVTNESDLAKPMAQTEILSALHVFERIELQPIEWEGDIQSPNFKQVKFWSLTPLSPALHGNWSGRAKVHASRVLYVDGADVPELVRLSSQGFGGSVLDSCWDSLRNRTTIGQAGSSMAQDFRVDVLKVAGLSDKSLADQQAWYNLRLSLMARARSMLSLIVIGENETYESRQTSVSGWGEISKVSAEDLAAETGIPLTRLYGLAPGGLNADGASQREMHGSLIARVQEQKLRGPLQRYYEVAGQVTGRKAGWIEFNPIYQPTAIENEALRKTRIEGDLMLVEAGVIDPAHVARSRLGEGSDGSALLPLSDQEIANMAEAAEDLAEQAIARSNQAPPPPPDAEAEDEIEED